MALKEDYKDAVFSGLRKYKMLDNGDGTVSPVDMTEYEAAGDKFGAKDVNAITKMVNCTGDAFDPGRDYEVGDYTIYDNTVWKFTTAHLAGEWDESHVEKTRILVELAAQNKNFDELTEKIAIPLTPVSQVTGYFAQLYKQGNHIFGNGRIAGMTSLPKIESVSSFDNWTGNLVAAATGGLRRIFSTSGNPFKLENNIYHIIGCGTRSTYNGTTGAIVTNSSVVAAMFDGENTYILLQYDAIPSASGSTQSGIFLIDTMV